MHTVGSIFSNEILRTSILAWFIAQVSKMILVLIQSRKMDFSRLVGSGGMPSSHSAFVMSMCVAVGEQMGYDSPFFGACLVIGLIVMYDAAGVRRAAGKQAAVLNKIIEEIEHDELHFEERLKELLGHTPIEVLVGAVLGIVIALICV
ncbi:divergent PAP2 family protein [Defluviitalea saccharophila]|uniref:Divergent PAP2 family protein n=1 Tax=Defluviitalea saccharophila TaxID=879970 RepID=A0ABZ2Y678_9FIRM|nr:divergent PAP2 family protein [Candidatus Epulonipiscium sp.]